MSDGEELRSAHDQRPVVRLPASSNIGLYAFLLLLPIGGYMVFSAVSADGTGQQAPRVTAPATNAGRIAPPPPLAIPQDMSASVPLRPSLAERAEIAPAPAPRTSLPPPAPRQAPVRLTVAEEAEPNTNWTGPRVVFEPARPAALNLPPLEAVTDTNRVQASRLANPSMTVPQGTVIPAVLETALDSTRPGGVRALIQRDVHSFDGSRVLIDRGSRLYGTYEAGLNPGEKRALIRWTRLIRPDGVTIALDSPASDPLGRAGVEGDVDSKFFARFGGAILQSFLDLGVGIATREATNGVVVALPGSTQNITAQTQQQVQPVLKVDHGTSVSVFVAQDLDFSSVER